MNEFFYLYSKLFSTGTANSFFSGTENYYFLWAENYFSHGMVNLFFGLQYITIAIEGNQLEYLSARFLKLHAIFVFSSFNTVL